MWLTYVDFDRMKTYNSLRSKLSMQIMCKGGVLVQPLDLGTAGAKRGRPTIFGIGLVMLHPT